MAQILDSWEELEVGVNWPPDINLYKSIVGNLWNSILSKIKSVQSIDISNPKEEAWFHLRRTGHDNDSNHSVGSASGRIELLRLREGVLSETVKNDIVNLAKLQGGVLAVQWWPWDRPTQNDYVEFLSFLQKLSALRGLHNIVFDRYLARVTGSPGAYSQCPYCEEAFVIMMSPNQPWSSHLKLWLDFIKTSGLTADRTHEYAHWFGHIISGWANWPIQGIDY